MGIVLVDRLADDLAVDQISRRSRKFDEEYGCDFLHSGNAVFDPAYLIPKTKWRTPRNGHKHIHGGDTCEGVPDGNYAVLETADLDTGEIIRQIRGRWKPDEFAERIHPWLMKAGGLVGIEANNTGHAVLLRLRQLWSEEAAKRGKDEMPYWIYGEGRRLGFSTMERSRKLAVIELEKALREDELLLAEDDTEGLAELRQWQYNDRMKEVAPPGGHDDTILAKAIMWQMRKWYARYAGMTKRRMTARAF